MKITTAQRLLLARIVIAATVRPHPLGRSDVDARVLPGCVSRGLVKVEAIPVAGTGRTVDVIRITDAGRIALDRYDREVIEISSGPTLLRTKPTDC